MSNSTTATQHRSRCRAVTIATIAALALSATPALANSGTDQSFYVSGTPDSAGGCAVYDTSFTAVGRAFCGSHAARWRFPDGRTHTYVIGMNHAIWNVINYAAGGNSGWRSLDGWTHTGVWMRWANTPSNLSIWTYGSNNGTVCDNYINGWSGWFSCVPFP
jgi:hypothetical protein